MNSGQETWTKAEYATYKATGEEPRRAERVTVSRLAALVDQARIERIHPLESVTLTLPWPPSLNRLYPTGSDTRRHLSAAGKDYHRQVGQAVLASWPRTMPRPLTARVALTMVTHEPDRRVRDISNLVKIVEDSLTEAGVWRDDSQVSELHIYRGVMVKDAAHVVVTIQPKGTL